jgi:cytoskeletal protein RodZ
MKTKTIGEILREERERHRVSLTELAHETRIRVQYLRLLEDNQFDQLPASTFVKGYIKTYAKLFGFDHEPLIAILRRDFKESAKGRLVPREFIKPLLKKRPIFQRPIAMVIVGLLLLLGTVGSYVGVQWYKLSQPPMVTIEVPADQESVSARVVVQGYTELDAMVTVNDQPVALQPDGLFRTEIFLSREGLNTLTVKATDRRGKTSVVQRTVRVQF